MSGEPTTAVDPLANLRADYPSAGWWVYHNGGLFDMRWAEDPPLAHVVNIGRGATTVCGRERFASTVPGGAWGPSLDRLGGLSPMLGEPPIAACPACLEGLASLPDPEPPGFRMTDHVIADRL